MPPDLEELREGVGEANGDDLEIGERLSIIDAAIDAGKREKKTSPKKRRGEDRPEIATTPTPGGTSHEFWVEEPRDSGGAPSEHGAGEVNAADAHHDDDDDDDIDLHLNLKVKQGGSSWGGAGGSNVAGPSRTSSDDVEELILGGGRGPGGGGGGSGNRGGNALWKIAQNRMSSVAAFQQKLIKKPRRPDSGGDIDIGGGSVGYEGVNNQDMDAQMDAWLRHTVVGDWNGTVLDPCFLGSGGRGGWARKA